MIESFADNLGQLSEFSLQPFPGGPAGPMSVALGELIAENPTPGISSQLVFVPRRCPRDVDLHGGVAATRTNDTANRQHA
jgi:hypothetical protein